MLTFNELLFIRKQLLEEDPNLPKLLNLSLFVDLVIDMECHRIAQHLRIKSDEVIPAIREAKIIRVDGKLEWYTVYTSNYKKSKINVVDYFYKIIVQELVRYIKMINTPAVEKIIKGWNVNV